MKANLKESSALPLQKLSDPQIKVELCPEYDSELEQEKASERDNDVPAINIRERVKLTVCDVGCFVPVCRDYFEVMLVQAS